MVALLALWLVGQTPAQSFVPPELVHQVAPVLPQELEALGGRVHLSIAVDANGHVSDAQVLETTDERLNPIALGFAHACVFSPATLDGAPVPVIIDYELTFLAKTREAPAQSETAPSPSYETRVVTRRVRDELTRLPVKLDESSTTSRYQLNRRDIELTPGSLEDISRTVQALPGVVADPGLLATFFVRGGDADEVVFYLDGVALTNPFHLGGFASLFNPELVRHVDFYAGAQPASLRDTLSGVLEINYLEGDTKRLMATGDLSMHTAKAVVQGPLPLEGASFVVSARRSYFEAYFAGLREFGVVGQNFLAPDLGEYYAKTSIKRGAHKASLSFLYATDGLSFASTQGEESLISFDGSLEITNDVTLLSAQHLYTPNERLRVTSTLGLMADTSKSERYGEPVAGQAALTSSGDTRLRTAVGRVDVGLSLTQANALRFGLEAQVQDQRFLGRVADTRTLPTWAFLPLAEYHHDTLDIAPRYQRQELMLYVEDEWQKLWSRVTPRAGVRVSVARGEPTLASPRAAVSVNLWPGAVGKLAWGLYFQRPVDALALNGTYGNPALRPERVRQWVLGLEQLLPYGALLKLEAYDKALSDLVVNTDVASDEPFTNDGFGFARGVDVLLMRRGERLGAALSYGFLHTERTNPTNELFVRRYAPMQAQAHTASLAVDYKLGETWVFVTRYQTHSGRPYTDIDGFVLEERDGALVYRPALGAPGGPHGRRLLNAERRPWFHEVSLRAEYWLRRVSWRLTIYAEVLNALNQITPYVDSYDEGVPSDGRLPEKGGITTLPIRPFLGVRLEY